MEAPQEDLQDQVVLKVLNLLSVQLHHWFPLVLEVLPDLEVQVDLLNPSYQLDQPVQIHPLDQTFQGAPWYQFLLFHLGPPFCQAIPFLPCDLFDLFFPLYP